jgi:glutamate transport system ATP-binding protein
MNTASDKTGELLRVDNVGKSYRGERVLSHVSFTQNAGDSTVILGPSGAGKSTLLRCIAGLESVESGSIYFGDKEIQADRRSRHELKGEIGMLFQSFNLFPHLTVLANVALAPLKVRRRPQEAAEERALELLAKVGMANKAESYPEELSGGQSQRVAIARALAMEPKLMLFDEPTSALDPELTKEVLDVMVQLVREGMTVIVVTHEMGFARRASNRVVFMADGRIIEEGPAETIFTRPTHERTSRFLEQILSY